MSQDAPIEKPQIRRAEPADTIGLADLRYRLWPDHPREGHAADLGDFFADKASRLAQENFVAVLADGEIVGFVEAGLRSHANGCDPKQPVGFIEGWFVAEPYRRRGIGAMLVRAAEDWARSKGCKEMASDTQIENVDSRRAHEGLGYAVVETCIDFRKEL
ncbi:MAG: GNAT family N-acetyltransferase [Vulcanimicrobiaceae bacterium]